MAKITDRHPMTPEEARWWASARDPQRAGRNLRLQYILSAAWSALTITWIVLIACGVGSFGWLTVIVLLTGFFNSLLGIGNDKRIIAGRKPWGDW